MLTDAKICCCFYRSALQMLRLTWSQEGGEQEHHRLAKNKSLLANLLKSTEYLSFDHCSQQAKCLPWSSAGKPRGAFGFSTLWIKMERDRLGPVVSACSKSIMKLKKATNDTIH